MQPVLTRVFRNGITVEDGFPISDVAKYVAEPDTVVWVDLCQPTKAQLDELAGVLDLHELAVEDALEGRHRPKLDRYDTHLFLVCQFASVDPAGGEIAVLEVNAFIGTRWIVTVRKSEDFPVQAVMDRWDDADQLATHGVSFLLYCLLDVVVDSYVDTVDTFEEFYDVLSDGMFSETPLDLEKQQHWFQMRRALVRFHRLLSPLLDVVNSLLRREAEAASHELVPYYQDVDDQMLRVVASTESVRELLNTIVETNYALRDYRQNRIMKTVTSWAAIVAVPTLITGYYGMNVPYPGFGETTGFIVSGALIGVISGGLALLFRRRGWL